MTERRPIRLAILTDDLIWATRLGSVARAAGAEPVVSGTAEGFAVACPGAGAALVDLSTRRSDPIAAIAAARRAGLAVAAVGPHEDQGARRRARAAGAGRVFAYRKLFEDGPRTIAAWLGSSEPVPPSDTAGPAREDRPALDAGPAPVRRR